MRTSRMMTQSGSISDKLHEELMQARSDGKALLQPQPSLQDRLQQAQVDYLLAVKARTAARAKREGR